MIFMKDGKIYAADGDGFSYAGTYTYSTADGAFTADTQNSNVEIDITGTASVNDKIDATYISSNGTTGEMALTFDENDYNRPSSFETLSGQWSTDTSSYVIDSEGGLTGTNGKGCTMAGAISMLDPNHNLYIIDADITECKLEGQYEGLVSHFEKKDSFIGVITKDGFSTVLGIVGYRQ
jgi:hypothetical protein